MAGLGSRPLARKLNCTLKCGKEEGSPHIVTSNSEVNSQQELPGTFYDLGSSWCWKLVLMKVFMKCEYTSSSVSLL